ncbi:hypothetical protein NBRC116592_03890 [Colwellia sp. KU-HH00111]|uniref:hypothetical protein n=1 Tax=Colwellia sp. KU-HH00111 TaxID=3127652 RepID=UPI0031076D7B
MKLITILLLIIPIFALASNDTPWTDWGEYKSFHDSEGRPVIVISYKTKFTKAGIARIKWKIQNASTLPAKRLGIEQKFYQSSDGTTKIVSGDSVSGTKKKPLISGIEKEFASDLFSSDNHGNITRAELRYPFFKAEFYQTDGSIVKITGESFETPNSGVVDCRKKYSGPLTTAEFFIDPSTKNMLNLSASSSIQQTNQATLELDLTDYLTSDNKKAVEKEFKLRFTQFLSGICGNEVKKTVTREAYNIVREAIMKKLTPDNKPLIIKPKAATGGIRN